MDIDKYQRLLGVDSCLFRFGLRAVLIDVVYAQEPACLRVAYNKLAAVVLERGMCHSHIVSNGVKC